jgi:uncharacterized protein YxeA
MAKHHKIFAKIKKVHFFAVVVIVLLIIVAGFFLYNRPIKQNNYSIRNKYYGFKLQTPKNWVAEENASYSEDNITKILEKCKNDKSTAASIYEVGAFRFEDQKYPENFEDTGYLPAGIPSGVILEITINCVSDSIKSQIEKSISGGVKVAGTKAIESFSNLSLFGKTEYLSFLHNNLQYLAKEYVYISPNDKRNEENLRANYTGAFNKIVSSFNFVK